MRLPSTSSVPGAAVPARPPGAAGWTCRSRWVPAGRPSRRAPRESHSPAPARLPSRSKRWLTSRTSSAAPATGCPRVQRRGTIARAPSARRAGGRAPEQQGDQAGAHQRHHQQRGIHVGVGRPALRPLQVPAEAGLHAHHFRHDQHRERRAQPHEKADEHRRHRRGDRDLQHQEALAGAHGAGDVVIGLVDSRDAGPGQHGDRKARGQRDQEGAGAVTGGKAKNASGSQAVAGSGPISRSTGCAQ